MERKLSMPAGQSAQVQQRVTIADRLAGGEQATLFKQPRIGENIIQGLLFFCGVLSIFTTLGIVLVLGTESLHLFTDYNWSSTNNGIVAEISLSTTQFDITSGGHRFAVGETMRISEEIMQITEVIDVDTLVVTRGLEGTTAMPHPANAPVFVGEKVTLTEFFTNSTWQPQAGEFGVIPLLTSTLRTAGIAMLVAIPLGLGAAIYLSEYATPRTRATLKPILELLAGIPTVVFGYFALTFMTPLLRAIFGQDTVQVYNVASAGIVMGIMIIPTIASISEDALSAVPRALREASYGLGATRLETIFRILLPAALSGIVAAFILGVSRAVGETMIVAIAAGAGPKFTGNPFEAAETITGHIARISTGDISYGSVDYNSLFALGLTLFVMTLALNILSSIITRRFREIY